MKKLFKIFTYFVVIILVLVLALLITAKLAENKITDMVLKKVSENVEAPVTIDHVSFNLLRKFPLATIELENVLLGAHKIPNQTDSFSNNLDTIISIQKVYVSVKSRPLIDGIIDVIKIDLKGARMNYLVDTSGISNIDFLIKSSETEETDTVPSEPLDFTLTDLSIENLICNYIDLSLKAKARVEVSELKVNAKIKGENINASANGSVSLSKCGFDKTNLYLMNKTDINFNLDYENDSIGINQFEVFTDGAKMDVLGHVILGDETKMDLKMIGSDLILGELVKYAPKEILKEYGLQKVSGKMNLNALVKGAYSENEIPRVDLTVNLQKGNITTEDYPQLKNISFSGKVTNGVLRNNQSTQASFSSFHFETNQSQFDVKFSVLDIDHPKYDIISKMNINLAEFKKYIPDTLIQSIDGNLKLDFSTKGAMPDSFGDDFIDDVMANSTANVNFENLNIDVNSLLSIKNFSAFFAYKPNSISIKNLNLDVPSYHADLKNTSFDADFKGSINKTSDLSVNLKSYHIETKGSTVTGSAKIKNLDNPDYEFESKIITNLSEAKEMLPDSLVRTLAGNVEINVRSKAKLKMDSLEFQMMDIVFKNSSYDVKLNNVCAELFDEPLYKIENVSGLMEMNPEAITINKMSGVAAGIDFEIDSTEIWNTYEAFIQQNKSKIFTLQTKIVLGEINNSLIGAFMVDTANAESTKLESNLADNEVNSQKLKEKSEVGDSVNLNYLIPDLSKLGIPHFLVRGKLAINKLEYEKNIIDNISLKFRFTDSLYVIDQFKLETCGGEINTSLLLNARGRFWEKPVIDLQSNISNLDIKRLLMDNDNFGDSSITYEKINGKLTSEMHLRVFYDNGDWPTNKVRAKGHFTLRDGRIYDYEPLVDLSKNKILGGLKGLDKLDFNTLTTSIFMLNDKIYLPKTDVVTSSMDMSAFAMHSLKGDFEYHLKVFLGDVMTGKSNDLLKKQAKQDKLDGEKYDRDGGLKLLSSEIEGNKKNGLDNKKSRENFQNKLNKQQGFLNLFFNQINVNFSTDLDRTTRNKELIEKYGGEKN